MKQLFFLVVATTLLLAPVKKAQSGEILIGAVLGISLSAGIAMTVLDNSMKDSNMDPYGRSDLFQDAIDALALNDVDAISEGLSAVILEVRKAKPGLDKYSDLEVLNAMMEFELKTTKHTQNENSAHHFPVVNI